MKLRGNKNEIRSQPDPARSRTRICIAAHAGPVKEDKDSLYKPTGKSFGELDIESMSNPERNATLKAQLGQPDLPGRPGDGGADQDLLHLVRLAVGYGVEKHAQQPGPEHRRFALLQHQHDLLQRRRHPRGEPGDAGRQHHQHRHAGHPADRRATSSRSCPARSPRAPCRRTRTACTSS